MADNSLLNRIARQSGGKLLNVAIDTLLPVDASKVATRTLLGGIAGAVAVRVASRSVPGAILVGGALVAKRLYDRRHSAQGVRAKDGQKRRAKA